MSDKPQFGELGKILSDKLGPNPSQKDIQDTIKHGYAKLETLSGSEKEELSKKLGKLEGLGKLESLGKLQGKDGLGKLESLGKFESKDLGKFESNDTKK